MAGKREKSIEARRLGQKGRLTLATISRAGKHTPSGSATEQGYLRKEPF
jgi:hypothetical protein